MKPPLQEIRQRKQHHRKKKTKYQRDQHFFAQHGNIAKGDQTYQHHRQLGVKWILFDGRSHVSNIGKKSGPGARIKKAGHMARLNIQTNNR
jgi:hypothetical protein